MSKPRIFISSTFYDLRNVRSDIDRFIREQGYEPVLFEKGHVAYGKEGRLEDDCYREISGCDILINIIGGRFGTQASDSAYSISQRELKTAIESGKQIYVFIERSVYAEYNTFLANRDLAGFKPVSVNDMRVFIFIEEILSLSGKNPVHAFEISSDIITYLREQWAGLFQALLQEHSRRKEVNLLERIENTAETLNQLVTFLTEERRQGDNAIKDILLSNHPIFAALRKVLSIPYPIIFRNQKEMNSLFSARKTELVESDQWDDNNFMEYISNWGKKPRLLKISCNLFDGEGKLKPMTPSAWNDNLVTVSDLPENNEDDIPF
jgi:hypothetical protein